MSSDRSTSSEGSPNKRRRSDHSIVLEHRLSHGLCHNCGTSLHNVLSDGRFEPRTIPGAVEAGRCLFCYPKPRSMPVQYVNVSDSTRASAATRPTFIDMATNGGDGEDSDLFGGVKDEEGMEYFNVARAPPRRETEDDDSTASGKLLTTSIRDADGVVFVGRIEHGNLRKGKGVFTHLHKDGENKGKVSVYEGEFENGLFQGTGISRDASGCVYEGDFLRGAAHGKGKCHWAEQGWLYEGDWANDKRHGQGTCRQMEEGGEVYSGSWKSDAWDGKGHLRFAGGGQYVGEFKKDKLHGKGRYTFADGSEYVGYFKNDMRQGHGEMTYADGFRYVGMWKNNWRNGKGTLFHPDGSVFKGHFRGDDLDGIGYLHLTDGIVRKQKWVNGVQQEDNN